MSNFYIKTQPFIELQCTHCNRKFYTMKHSDNYAFAKKSMHSVMIFSCPHCDFTAGNPL